MIWIWFSTLFFSSKSRSKITKYKAKKKKDHHRVCASESKNRISYWEKVRSVVGDQSSKVLRIRKRKKKEEKKTRAKIQGTRMFSNNLQHKQLYRWLCNKTTKSTEENILDDPTPYITIVSANGNSITYNNNFDYVNNTIDENGQNSVSPQI